MEDRSGDGERDRFVEIVDTDVDEKDDDDLECFRGLSERPSSSDLRLRPLSASFFASSSSAIPVLLAVRWV